VVVCFSISGGGFNIYSPSKPPTELWVTGRQEAGDRKGNFASPYGCTEETPTGQGFGVRISTLLTIGTKHSECLGHTVACWSLLSSRRQKMKG